MRRPRHTFLVDKAIEACLAAIEVYNKPAFAYREETFSVLMINAWELLLKARILSENKNKMRSIEVWERKRKRDGTESKLDGPKLTRAGNRMTIGLSKAAEIVRQYSTNSIDQPCVENLALLAEIRDNAVHFRNKNRALAYQVYQVGSAALKNFAFASQSWFSVDLSIFNLFLMPIAFDSPSGSLQAVVAESRSMEVGNLLRYIKEKEAAFPFIAEQKYSVGLQIELRFVRGHAESAVPVQVTRDGSGLPVTLSEESVRQSFPWDYRELCRKLKERYADFKQDKKFIKLRQKAQKKQNLCRIRLLDPAKPTSPKKWFYSPNVVGEFDGEYTKRA